MTQAQAQSCAAAIIGAGFDARVHRKADATWIVLAQSGNAFIIPSASIAALVASQGVAGNVAEVEFS